MYKTAKRTYVVVGVDHELAKEVEKAKYWLQMKKGRKVTRTEALRSLLKVGLAVEKAMRDPLPAGFIGLNTDKGIIPASELT